MIKMTSPDRKKEELFARLSIEEINSGTFYGKWSKPKTSALIKSYSPIDGSLLASVIPTSSADYDKVVSYSEKIYTEWVEIPPPKRGSIMLKVGQALRTAKEDLGMLVTLEAGKTISEGKGEIQEMIDIADFSVGLSRQLEGLVLASERPWHRMMEQYVPLGPIGIISSFNFPSSVWSWNAFIAAVCGDTSIWKPSSKTPLAAVAIMKVVSRILEEEAAPQIFSLVTGSGEEIGSKMSSDRRIKLISFTGSVDSGRKVSQLVSERLGKSILELGGNNAAVVSEHADMQIALKGVAFGALATAGQRCTSTRRVIVNNRIYDTFVKKMEKIYSEVSVGDPRKSDTLVGPLIDESAVRKFESAISEAQKEGGRLLAGGTRTKIRGLDGYYVKPALIEATPEMKICKTETFAPILYVFKYHSLQEAVQIHNSVPQGLSSSIFTNDLLESEYFISHRGSDCGIVNVNTGTAGAEIGGAFGGEKDTGGGRESGSDAWKNYMRRQTITINYGRELPLAQGVEFKI
jgi:aldehyde dehydrogenase (NAD+)